MENHFLIKMRFEIFSSFTIKEMEVEEEEISLKMSFSQSIDSDLRG
jgi:hypothetical protein